MECKRCGNKDPTYFYKGHKGYYCRKCVIFKRTLLLDELQPLDYEISKEVSAYHFTYPLTPYQEEVSIQTLASIKDDNDVLLRCVCGAGKTEIVVRTIADYLDRGLKVCYAIPRKEVVKELYIRFTKIFSLAKVVALYGGHHDQITGDLIICTTHQLFRFYKTFDLLILDEADAFPLSGNDELMNIALNSTKGHIIFSTATVNDFITNKLSKRKIKELNLYLRPSLKPLIVPKNIYGPKFLLLLYLYILMRKTTNQCIIFVTSKKECRNYYRIFKTLSSCTYVYSELENGDKNIKDFKEKKYKFIFSTTVLERGITIKDVDVIVLDFIRNVFSKESLIQMLGRVGRNYLNPYGNAYVLSCYKSASAIEAKKEILEANRHYEMLVLRQSYQ